MKYIERKRPKKQQARKGHKGRYSSLNNLCEVANVKHLNAVQKKSINGKRKNRNWKRNAKNKARVGLNVVDARLKLLQKALEKPKVVDAREKINERRLQSILNGTKQNNGMARKSANNDHYNNLGGEKCYHNGIFTHKYTLDERKHEDTNISDSPSHIKKRNAKKIMFNQDGYQDDQLDKNSKNRSCLSETFHSRLDSRPKSSTMGAQPIGYRIIVSNLEVSVTCEDIKELFEDVGDLLYSKMIQPGVAEATYVHYADAIKAIDMYHNRLLDGKPMKCEMVMNADSNTEDKHRH